MKPGGNPGPSALVEALKSAGPFLDHCVHCGFCLPACPTYVRLGDEADSPRGRLHLMRAVAEERLDPASEAFQTHLDRCLGCRACETVCPSGVEYGHLLERAREVAREAQAPEWPTRLLLSSIARPFPFAVWMTLSRFLRWTRLPRLLARALPTSGRLAQTRLALAMLDASGPSPLQAIPRGDFPLPRGEEGSLGGLRVGVLKGCVQDGLFRRVNDATHRVLLANGFEVRAVEGQGCCGALHAHAGDLETARALARRNIEAFEAGSVDEVAVNAAGCGSAMKSYAELFDAEPEWRARAQAFAARVKDLSEVLAGPGRVPRVGAALHTSVVYDPPCHLLHAQRVSDPPLRLLRSIPGLQILPLRDAETCCGGAGIYGLTHPGLGGAIGGDKAQAVLESGAALVTTGNPGCAMQIGAQLSLKADATHPVPPVCHPVELLAESYRRAGYDLSDPQA
jgi:glycolate oxidase iron-sulfur subunit